jgi:hypothetical protein
MQHCKHSSKSELDGKLMTRHRNVLMTESRLQLALRSGLTVEGWTFDKRSRGDLICRYSLEPEKVITLLRVRGVPWSTMLCNNAATNNKLAVLQWLHSCSCPWEEEPVLMCASARGSIAMLQWLWSVTSPWPSALKLSMLYIAACDHALTVVQWLRAHGADWPTSFSIRQQYADTSVKMSWRLSAVQWALASGSGWLQWKCEDYAADNYELEYFGQKATKLLEWAHVNSCSCTCGHVQQKQQQQ